MLHDIEIGRNIVQVRVDGVQEDVGNRVAAKVVQDVDTGGKEVVQKRRWNRAGHLNDRGR
jgi:hypothetical protein